MTTRCSRSWKRKSSVAAGRSTRSWRTQPWSSGSVSSSAASSRVFAVREGLDDLLTGQLADFLVARARASVGVAARLAERAPAPPAPPEDRLDRRLAASALLIAHGLVLSAAVRLGRRADARHVSIARSTSGGRVSRYRTRTERDQVSPMNIQLGKVSAGLEWRAPLFLSQINSPNRRWVEGPGKPYVPP